MTIVMRPSYWHKKFGPNGLSAPTLGLCLNFFSSVTADFNISSAISWAIQDQWSLKPVGHFWSFYVHHWGGGKAAYGFGADWIRTVVSMATESPYWLIMRKTMSPRFLSCFLSNPFYTCRENWVSMLAHSFLIKSLSKLQVIRTGIKAQTSSFSDLWFPWPIYMIFEMRGCQVWLVDDQKICF